MFKTTLYEMPFGDIRSGFEYVLGGSDFQVSEYGPRGMFIEKTSTSVSYVRWLKITRGQVWNIAHFFRFTECDGGWVKTVDTEDNADRLIGINLKLREDADAYEDDLDRQVENHGAPYYWS